jgi:hypothetical protein
MLADATTQLLPDVERLNSNGFGGSLDHNARSRVGSECDRSPGVSLTR